MTQRKKAMRLPPSTKTSRIINTGFPARRIPQEKICIYTREDRISISNTTSLHNHKKTDRFPEKGKNCFYAAERRKRIQQYKSIFYKAEKNVLVKRTNNKNVLDERTFLGYTDNRKNPSCMERFAHERKEWTAGRFPKRGTLIAESVWSVRFAFFAA